MDEFVVFEQFIVCWMQPDEFMNVYLAELQKLAVLFGAVSDCTIRCAFVAELPTQVRQLFRASS